ncbi:hypothetical protein E4U32_001576 [Claviceps aff. humidiphila group G2b]|nr:hypothetical protein E4U32_001576 [Claviceps aff. humidiphila group G2b]
MMNLGPSPGTHQPILLPPRTPSELLQDVLSHSTRQITVVIGWPKEQFLAAMIQEVRQQQQQQPIDSSKDQHPLLRAPLMQIATARHITIAFAPTVCHLRAYLATWTASSLPTPSPLAARSACADKLVQPPLLIVYGLLDLHRHGAEWSAQGLSISAAILVQGAWRSGCRAVLLEPRSREGGEGEGEDQDELSEMLAERLPVLSRTVLREDGSWAGPVVRVTNVLGEWFKMGGLVGSY